MASLKSNGAGIAAASQRENISRHDSADFGGTTPRTKAIQKLGRGRLAERQGNQRPNTKDGLRIEFILFAR